MQKIVSKFLSSVVMFTMIAVSFIPLTVPRIALAAVTGTLTPDGQGFYSAWNGNEGDIDETGTPSCSTSGGSDVIDTSTTGNRESVNLNLSSIPNGSTITSVDVSVWYSSASSGSGATFKTFTRLDGSLTDAGADLVANSTSSSCGHNSTQTINVTDTIKSGSTDLEIGVLKTATDTSTVRVGAIRAIVTYTESEPTVGGYAISQTGNATINGLSVSINGVASAEPFVGQLNDQHISVDWDDDGDGIADLWEEEDSNSSGNDAGTTSNITFDIDSYDDSGNDKFFQESDWSASHTYLTYGAKKIFVRVHHASANGAEGSDVATIQIDITIAPQCSNGTDDDGDALADYPADPGCTGLADDSESPNPSTPPILSGVPSEATIPEVVLYTFDADATDSDIPANTLTFSLVGIPPFGSSIDSSTGVFTWTPFEEHGPGIYPVTVRVSDGVNEVDSLITITVLDVNVAPVANDDNAATSEDSDATISLASLLSNDTDSDIPVNTLSVTGVSNPSNGAVVIDGGNAVFTPDVNFNGTAGFDYTLSDGSATDIGHVVVTVDPLNDDPTLSPIENKEVDELNTLSFTVAGADIDDDTLTYSISSGLEGGMTLNPSTGEFTWTPDETKGPGSYPVTISVSDGSETSSQDFTITVNEVNVSPVASGSSVSTPMNTDLDITLSATDGDLPANTLTYTVASGPTNGTVDINDNIATYSPNSDYTGSDSFNFEVCDQDEACDSATIEITVSNDAPIMDGIDDQIVDELVALSLTATTTDTGSDPLTYSLSNGPSGASVDSVTGVFSWTPTEGEGPGNYQVTISVTDGAAIDSKTFNITVNEVNVAPVAIDDSISTDEDTPVTIVLPTATDSDVPAQALIYVLVDMPSSGSASISGNLVLYSPNANYNGADSFTYKANDGVTDSNVAMISITIDPVNDAPTITLNGPSEVAFVEGGSYTDEGASCVDTEDESPFAANVSGSFDPDVAGTYTLTYQCEDENEAESSTVTRTIVVQSIPAQCSDSSDNDEDGKTDMEDPGCAGPLDNDETDPAVVVYECSDGIDNDGDGGIDFGGDNGDAGCENSSDNSEGSDASRSQTGSGRRRTTTSSSGGEVLGAETSCGIYVTEFLRRGYKGNNLEAVAKLQQFLNDYFKAGLAVDKKFGPKTEGALKTFQLAHKEKILTPWNLVVPTGIFYLTTQTEVNNIMCPDLMLPIPQNLIPFSANPLTPKI